MSLRGAGECRFRSRCPCQVLLRACIELSPAPEGMPDALPGSGRRGGAAGSGPGRPEGGRLHQSREREIQGQGAILDTIHSGGVPRWTGFGLCGFWSSNSTSSAGHQWDDSLLQNRVFQSGTIPAPVWVLKIPSFSTSSPVWSLKIHDFSISDQFGSLPAWVFPFLTSFWTPGLPVTGHTSRSAVRESQLEAIHRLNGPAGWKRLME